MAKIINLSRIPAAHSAGSLAEARVLRLLEELPQGYSIISNITIFTDNAQRALTEFDVVVITPLGAACVLEVKSGSLQQDGQGQLLRLYCSGTSVSDISQQLARQQQVLVTRLRQFDEGILFEHFLVLPNGTLTSEGAAINQVQGRVFDSSNIDKLNERIIALNDQAAREGKIFDKAALEHFFFSRYTYKPSAAAICDALLAEQEKTEIGLAAWVPRIQTSLPYVVVEAPAGAGKSALAKKLLKSAGEQGKKALYLSFARNTAEQMLESGAAVRAAFAGTWHELAIDCEGHSRDVAKLDEATRNNYFAYCSERLMYELERGRYSWDLIVVDDAQDFMQPWLKALARGLSENGRMYALGDPYACIFEDREGFEVEENKTVFVKSEETLRVPQCQAQELRAFGLVSKDFCSANAFEGESTFVAERYSDADGLLKETRRTLRGLLDRGFRPDQICLLSWRGAKTSIILGEKEVAGLKLKRPLEQFDANNMRVFSEGELLTDTLRRFGGRCAPCVVITEMDFDVVDEQQKALLYLAMTRAQVSLSFVMSTRAYRALGEYLQQL